MTRIFLNGVVSQMKQTKYILILKIKKLFLRTVIRTFTKFSTKNKKISSFIDFHFLN